MKRSLYPRLSATGIWKNRQLYLPYMLTCAGMVAMYYIIRYLQRSPLLDSMFDANWIYTILGLGGWVVALFALAFLFYTNSFLVRRRMQEFGLYSILGMGKGNICLIVIWDALINAVVSLAVGLFVGISFSKLAELLMVRLMEGEVSYHLYISTEALMSSIGYFGIIFFLIMCSSLIRVRRASAISLWNSESTGEKAPKANWLFGIAGIALLAFAYYLAVSIREPLSALLWFFVAVLMVIAGTYLTFISGSVLLCRILMRIKRFYYKASHFVTVSSMTYRMKRNGAGLASICILATMVLVILATTTCLYFGGTDVIYRRYPRHITCTVHTRHLDHLTQENTDILRGFAQELAKEKDVDMTNILDYRLASLNGSLNGDVLTVGKEFNSISTMDLYGNLRAVYFMSLEDYNRIAGTQQELAEDEILLYAMRSRYEGDTFTIDKYGTFRVKEHLDTFPVRGESAMYIAPSIFVVVPKLDSIVQLLSGLANFSGDALLQYVWYYGFDLPLEDGQQIEFQRQYQRRCYRDLEEIPFPSWSIESRAYGRADFFSTCGSLLFLGMLLSIVFLFAAVLMIYYKQITEGYEDRSRFDIMQKVGMTKRDIRKSIDSQLVIVFLLPLTIAGVHLCFAFPILYRILMLFNLFNLPLLIATTAISFLLFALFYLFVYRMTANAYFRIVSDR